MSRIARLYIPFLENFSIRTLDQFVDKFYVRMGRERFEGLLRSFQIRPSQHDERFVIEALGMIGAKRSGDETQSDASSISSPESLSSDSVILSSEQVSSIRETIASIDTRLRIETDPKRRENLNSRKRFLVSRIDEARDIEF